MPKVSVNIPTHNRSELLRVAIQSVLQQTFQDFEIVVVDDASTDNTEDVVNNFGDQRIKYIRHKTNQGEATTRNTGLKNGKGVYIAFLDDDDEWLPDKLQMQVAILDHSPKEVGGVYTGRVIMDGTTGRILGRRLASKRENLFLDLLRQRYNLTPSTLMIRQICFEKVGWFDESIGYAPDFDMWVRLAKEFDFECIEEPLTIYRVHEKQLTKNIPFVIEGRERQLEKYSYWLSMNPQSHSALYLNLGILYCLNENSKKGRTAYRKSIALYPYRIKPYFILFLTYMGTNVFRKVTNIWNKLSAPLD